MQQMLFETDEYKFLLLEAINILLRLSGRSEQYNQLPVRSVRIRLAAVIDRRGVMDGRGVVRRIRPPLWESRLVFLLRKRHRVTPFNTIGMRRCVQDLREVARKLPQ